MISCLLVFLFISLNFFALGLPLDLPQLSELLIPLFLACGRGEETNEAHLLFLVVGYSCSEFPYQILVLVSSNLLEDRDLILVPE